MAVSGGATAPPIIVGGCHRSGTSLLRRLLDAHSRIHCGPEVKFFRDFYGDYVRDDLAHARLFSSVRTLGLDDGELLDVFGRAFIEVHERAARRRGKARWADKSPENAMYANQWQRLLGGRLAFVHLVRDPRDVLASLLEARFDKAVPVEFRGKVELCRRYLESAADFVDRHPAISRTVRYEELVARPEETLEALFTWLQEPFERAVLRHFNDAERQEGLEDPKVKQTLEVHTRSVGRWRSELSVEQVRIAQAELAGIAGRYGYDLSPHP
ncbi:MAG: hypothetical protein QOD06_3239 [Candidatus Binatota bacterium]|nr:hypothetical protein [Candidatus Binatota bacterium]